MKYVVEIATNKLTGIVDDSDMSLVRYDADGVPIENPDLRYVTRTYVQGTFLDPMDDAVNDQWIEGASAETLAANMETRRGKAWLAAFAKITAYRATKIYNDAIQNTVYNSIQHEARVINAVTGATPEEILAAKLVVASNPALVPTLTAKVVGLKRHFTGGVIPPGQSGGKSIPQAIVDEVGLANAKIVPLKVLEGKTDYMRSEAEDAITAATTVAGLNTILSNLETAISQLP